MEHGVSACELGCGMCVGRVEIRERVLDLEISALAAELLANLSPALSRLSQRLRTLYRGKKQQDSFSFAGSRRRVPQLPRTTRSSTVNTSLASPDPLDRAA